MQETSDRNDRFVLKIDCCNVYVVFLAVSIAISASGINNQLASLFSYLALAVGVFGLIGNRRRVSSFKNKTTIIVMAVLFVLYVLLSYYISNAQADVTSYGRLKSVIIITLHSVISVCYIAQEIRERNFYVFMYIVSVSLLAIFIVNFGIDTILSSIVSGTRLGNEIYAINKFGILFAYSAVFALFCLLNNKNKILHALLFFGSVLCCFSTGSRTGILLIVVGAMLLFLILQKKSRFKQAITIVAIITVVVTILESIGVMDSVIYRVSTIWTGNDAGVTRSDLSRSNMIKVGFDYWKSSPIFGVGFNCFALRSYFGTYAHNNYIQILSELGSIGAVLFYFPRIKILTATYRTMKCDDVLLYKLLFILMMLTLMSDMTIVSYYDLSLNYIYLFAIAFCGKNYYSSIGTK